MLFLPIPGHFMLSNNPEALARFWRWRGTLGIPLEKRSHHHDYRTSNRGFTLIEIAIVLVIIGLLLGGVLKGQELINNAKVKSYATDFRNIPIMIYGFQDKFRALPGDDARIGTALSRAPRSRPRTRPVARQWRDQRRLGYDHLHG